MTTTPPDHVHYVVSLEDEEGVNTKTRVTRLSIPILVAFDIFKQSTLIDAMTTEFTTQYKFDVDGNTETIDYSAVLMHSDKTTSNLTISMRTCYCTPLNENEPTPF